MLLEATQSYVESCESANQVSMRFFNKGKHRDHEMRSVYRVEFHELSV